MKTRRLSIHESDNLARIHEAGLPVALFFVTDVHLGKSNPDATEPMREMFGTYGVHDYAMQRNGSLHKVVKPTILLGAGGKIERSLSLYRTGRGDQRMNVLGGGLRSFALAGNVCAVFVRNGVIHFLNLSRSLLGHEVDLGINASAEAQLIRPLIKQARSTANELLDKLRAMAGRGPIKAVCVGSKAVGRTVEHALDLKENASEEPDYKGIIELKSGRSNLLGAEPRAQLFTKVPDWNLSRFKSIREFLEKCGYKRDVELRLCCTVNSLRENPQGLLLRVKKAGTLEECSQKHRGSVLVWSLDTLENKLLSKHRDTFWIKARTIMRNGNEWFELLSVIHTRNPVEGQFARLLNCGSITLDHEISGGITAGARERGPAFKVERHRLGELFRGVPSEYDLT
jgi:hypothetical protein